MSEVVAQKFSELTPTALFNILKLRQDVFVVEQDCAYPDIDDTDLVAIHVQAMLGAHLSSYARIIPLTKNTVQVGRVCVNPEDRGKQFARKLVTAVITIIKGRFPETEVIFIQAQSYLLAFYKSFGFEAVSEVYLEDNIPHINMELHLKK